jgi:hypothetical protein
MEELARMARRLKLMSIKLKSIPVPYYFLSLSQSRAPDDFSKLSKEKGD